MSYINLKRYFAIALSLFMLTGISIFYFTQQAQAEGPRSPRGPGRAPAQSAKRAPAPQHNNFVDSRYQHNHSYPARGQSVRSLPRDHRAVMYGHSRYYSSNGAWYRPHRGRFAVVAPPIGLFVPFLPFAYTTIWMTGIPYYYANETYYTQTAGGYVVVEPPQGDVSQTPPATEESTESKMFIYPRNGQSEEQQARDRYECHTWAVGQTNYDPTRSPSGIPDDQIMQKRDDYQRAMASCLDGRGYTAK
ncbi:MAG: DUF6515 family protein [Deltaproteobacteria bacterium]|nr:DUF6515 family protein [Deltaproteobacteria bacterium]